MAEIKKAASLKGLEIKDDDILKINNYTLEEVTAEQVFCFKIAICDNQIDRTFERFSDEALEKMLELFKGKTIIKDHNRVSDNQVARIYDTYLETVGGVTSLIAKCYMIKTASTESLIEEIKAGIKKEVSVCLSLKSAVCSICGTDNAEKLCRHFPGRKYEKKGKEEVCHFVLDSPEDAYEVSFVAVPAQREAGVRKDYGGAEVSEDIDDEVAKKKAAEQNALDAIAVEAEALILRAEGETK